MTSDAAQGVMSVEQAAADAEILSLGSAEGWYCDPCATLWSFAQVDWGQCPQCGAYCALRFDDGECIVTDLLHGGEKRVTDVCDPVEGDVLEIGGE